MKATVPPLFSISETRAPTLRDYQLEWPERRRMWSLCAPALALSGVLMAEMAVLARWSGGLPFSGWNTMLVFATGVVAMPLLIELRLGLDPLLRIKRTTSLTLSPGEVLINRRHRFAWNTVKRIWLQCPPDRSDWKITFEWGGGKGSRRRTLDLADSAGMQALVGELLAPRRFEGAVYRIVKGAPPAQSKRVPRGGALCLGLSYFFAMHALALGLPIASSNLPEEPPALKKPIPERLREPKKPGPELPKFAVDYIRSHYRSPEEFAKGFRRAGWAGCALFAGCAWLAWLGAGYCQRRRLSEDSLAAERGALPS